MDHGGEAAASADLAMAGAVQGSQTPHMNTSTFHDQFGAAAATRRTTSEPSATAYDDSAEFTNAASGGAVPVPVFYREPGPVMPYAYIIGAYRGQLGPVDVVLVGPQLPGVVMPVHDGHYSYSVLQHRPGGVDAVHDDDYGYYAWQPRPGFGRAEFPGPLPGGVGSVFIGRLPHGVGVVFDGHGNFARQTLPAWGTRGGADGIAGALRGPSLGVVGEHLRRLLPFAGIGASSLAVNGLATGPGSPAVAFHLFMLLLGGLFLIILHVLCV